MPIPFSAERFYALTGRAAPAKPVEQTQTVNRVLPEVQISGNAKLQEDAVLNNSGDFLYEVYDSLCETEVLYKETARENCEEGEYSDADRIFTAERFQKCSADYSLLQTSISGQRISYEGQSMLDIIESSSGVLSNQDMQYLKNSAKKINSISSNIKQENTKKLSRITELNDLLHDEAKKQNIVPDDLLTLSPEGLRQLEDYLKREYQQSLSLRNQLENASFKSPEYHQKLAEIRAKHKLDKAPADQNKIMLQQSMMESFYQK